MARQLTEDDIKLVDKVLDLPDGKSGVKCPYCDSPIETKYIGASYEVSCETENCFRAIFRGI